MSGVSSGKSITAKQFLTWKFIADSSAEMWLAFLVSTSILMTGCGSGGSSASAPSSPTPTITAVSVSCTPASVQTGQTSQCSVTVSVT